MVDKKYDQIIDNVVDYVGGRDNIASFSNCITRLRINVKDKSLVKDDTVQKAAGVMGTQFAGNQYQIIIGPNVTEVADAINTKHHLAGNDRSQNESSEKSKFSFSAIVDGITASITPALPALIGAGMINVVLILLTTFGLLSTESTTYTTLSFVADAGFYFLPIYVGAASARRFGMDMWLGMLMGAIFIHPNFVATLSSGEPGTLFGIPIYVATYTSTIFPVLLTNLVASYLYKWLNKTIPKAFKSMVVPFLTVLVMAPLAILALGPVGALLGTWLAALFIWIYETIGFVGLALLGFAYPWMIITGMHQGFGPYLFQTLAERGSEGLLFPLTYVNNINQGIAAVAVSLKSKDTDIKSTATSVAVPALFAGVTEPALFGLNLRYRTPLYATMMGNLIGCGLAGFFGTVGYAFVGSFGLFGLPAFIGDKPNNLLNIILSIAFGSLVTFVATWLLYKDPVEEVVETETSDKTAPQTATLASPLTGQVHDLSEVPDPIFAQGVLGQGVAIQPTEGKVLAPADAEVTAVMPSKHAIGLTLSNGAELLIHVGIDTVNLDGQHYECHVSQGQSIKAGDLLLEFDIKAIEEAGYQTITPVVITNSTDYQEILPLAAGQIQAGQTLLELK